MLYWKVVPLCDAQLTDVDPKDILDNGLFRKCNVYKSGGGYDRLPAIIKKRFDVDMSNQFVVQLYGCPFSCPYCYVTKAGVFGNFIYLTSYHLMYAFKKYGLPIFHLMGGAPALYAEQWKEIIELMPDGKIFTSDIMLLENDSMWDNEDILAYLGENSFRSIFAVSIKGTSKEEFEANTGQSSIVYDEEKIVKRLKLLIKHKVNFYLTFTGCTEEGIKEFENLLYKNDCESALEDAFSIDIIKYNAIDFNKK